MKGKIYTHTPQQSSRCTENGVKKVCFFIFFFLPIYIQQMLIYKNRIFKDYFQFIVEIPSHPH
jgi:hypothetical protein